MRTPVLDSKLESIIDGLIEAKQWPTVKWVEFGLRKFGFPKGTKIPEDIMEYIELNVQFKLEELAVTSKMSANVAAFTRYLSKNFDDHREHQVDKGPEAVRIELNIGDVKKEAKNLIEAEVKELEDDKA